MERYQKVDLSECKTYELEILGLIEKMPTLVLLLFPGVYLCVKGINLAQKYPEDKGRIIAKSIGFFLLNPMYSVSTCISKVGFLILMKK